MDGIRVNSQSLKTIRKLESLSFFVKKGMEVAAWKSGRGLMSATSQEILRKPKGGRTYIRRDRIGRRRRHVASAAGETHANMSGRLRRALSFRVNPLEIEFGYGVTDGGAPDYAAAVEFGTRRMAARPSLRNGIAGERRNMMNNFDREIMGDLK